MKSAAAMIVTLSMGSMPVTSFAPVTSPACSPAGQRSVRRWFPVVSSSAASPDELSGGSTSGSSDSNVDVTSSAYRESLLANLDEVARAKYGVQTEEEKAKSAAAAKVASFNAFDTNADGVVDVEEVQQGLMDKFGVSATLAEIRAAIKDFDVNGDGVLEMDEFKIGLLKMRIVAIQDAGRKQRPVTQRRTDNSSNDRDGPGGRGGGGGGGIGLWGRQLSPMPVPVPVEKKKPGEWFF